MHTFSITLNTSKNENEGRITRKTTHHKTYFNGGTGNNKVGSKNDRNYA